MYYLLLGSLFFHMASSYWVVSSYFTLPSYFHLILPPVVMCQRVGLLVTHVLSFCLFWNVFIFPSLLKDNFSGYSVLDFFSFSTLNILTHCLLTFNVSVDKSAQNLFKDPLYVISSFPLAAFKILCLFLAFEHLVIMCVDVDLFEFCLPGGS